MNLFVSKFPTTELQHSDMKVFCPDAASPGEISFFLGLQSLNRVANSLMSRVDEIEREDIKLILVADDEPLTSELVEEFLEQAEIKCIMITAANGAKAYDLANSLAPDLIITDWLMPEVSGPELVRKLKANPRTEQIPVILMTGILPSPDNLGELVEAGVTDYLRKPLDYAELMALVKRSLELD